MKTITRIMLLLVLLAALVLPGTAFAQGNDSGVPDKYVTGNYHLADGETLDGNLWIMGGNATLEKGSHVTGNINLTGGSLHVDGEVDGNIAATGGYVELANDAVVHGDISMVGAHLERNSDAQVDGEVITGPIAPFQNNLPGIPSSLMSAAVLPLKIFGFFAQIFLVAALGVMVVMFWPRQTARVAQTSVSQPLVSGGLGLLTMAAAPALVLVLTITIILIPASLVLILALVVVALFGWAALGLEVGNRMSVMFKQNWTAPVAGGLGTLLLSLVAGGLWETVPCIGWLVAVLIGTVGLGAVLLTRFGTQPYPAYVTSSAVIVPPASAPAEPPATPVVEAPASEETSGGAAAYPLDDEPPVA